MIYLCFSSFFEKRIRRARHFTGKGLRGALLSAALLGPLGGIPAAASITGVCPDGSMFIVKKEVDIPCRRAKQVDPQDMPPIRPAYLPRPHAWQIFQSQQDPNNPYNLVDRARDVRDAAAPPGENAHEALPPVSSPGEPAVPPQISAARVPVATPPVSALPPTLSPPVLDNTELRDLGLLIGLSQEKLPARFPAEANGALQVEIAHSQAFETQLKEHFTDSTLGPVVVFSVRAEVASDFYANFTFVQGHIAFNPDPEDPQQLGILAGALGHLATGERLIGYTVLPANVDLSQPTDVYWNDRRISVALRR